MTHPVVFAEVHGADGAALRRFSADLFGWAFQEMPGADYGMAPPAEGGIVTGSARRRPGGRRSHHRPRAPLARPG